MFKVGLKHGAIVLVIVAVATILSMLTKDKSIIAFAMDASTILSWLAAGYLYKKNHGPLITFQLAPAMGKNLLSYILGVGLIWGPAKLLLVGFPIEDAPILANVILAIIAVPFSGFAVVGAIIVGGWFYKGDKKPLTSGST